MSKELTDFNQDEARLWEERVKKEALLRMQENQLFSLDAIQRRDREIIECEREIARKERNTSKILRWCLSAAVIVIIGLTVTLLWKVSNGQ